MEHREGWGKAEAAAADNATARSQAADRDRVRVEFYATYDVMTGVRIAATLGGFFALMVFLIVYKSRSKSVKALNDPKIVELAEAAVAEEEAVEEERQLTAALEEALSERRRSRAAGEPRAGYGSLLTAAAARGRRASSATCSSSGSSYLERRGSSVVCALPERRASRASRAPLAPLAPLASTLAERRAPLASAASAAASFAVECELASVGADSVFADDGDGDGDGAASTDDEVEQFSTDSGGGECTELASRPARAAIRAPRPDRASRVPSHSHSRETLF